MELQAALAQLEVLPDYDAGSGPGPCVHTFRSSAVGVLLGAHWPLEEVRVAMERFGVEEAGGVASALGHGLVVVDDHGPVFFATRSVRDRVAASLDEPFDDPARTGARAARDAERERGDGV